jgi:hypothetical protein
MPILTKQGRWKDDQLVVAWASLAAEQYVICRGERLRGSDPRVQAHPDVFVDASVPESEWPPEIPWDKVASAPQEPEFHRGGPLIPDAEAVVAAEDVAVGQRYVRQGQRLRRTDPLVREHPHFFTEVPRRLTAEEV